MEELMSFYKGKKVLITGHTGFKGSWLSAVLLKAGAVVTGYSLQPPTTPSLFELASLEKDMDSVTGDIRDYEKLKRTFDSAAPEFVFHLAAQPLVRESYRNPKDTYEVNVMGTVNVLECVRNSECVKSVVNVTTDKVYENNETGNAFSENVRINGYDPYSNSKSCSELVTGCYIRSFLTEKNIAVSTVRAGNVIGGGDFSRDRIIPDCIRAVTDKKAIGVRNPDSVRPYQHVLEPLFVYLMIARKQYEDQGLAGSYNVGPDETDCVATKELVSCFCEMWGDAEWINQAEKNAPHEAGFLRLDCTKLKETFHWKPKWDIWEAINKTCEFSKVWLNGGNVRTEMDREIEEFLES
ncbi:MAG: CDP-glucose 4,6-dehydratase [Alistipes sp.]|nr:CDP-glucose 4,6-dehydratase [Alistipes sp.]